MKYFPRSAKLMVKVQFCLNCRKNFRSRRNKGNKKLFVKKTVCSLFGWICKYESEEERCKADRSLTVLNVI